LLKVALVHVAAALGGHHRFFEMSKLLGVSDSAGPVPQSRAREA
jgi:hypothetical protein